MNKKMLTIDDIAKTLKCTRRTLYRFRVQGKMPAPLFIDITPVWPAKDINRWIELECPSQKTFDIIKGLEEKLKAAKAPATVKTKVKVKPKAKKRKK